MFLQEPRLAYPPQRIVSLVPSITELLYHLDLQQETVGITKFCIHPAEWFQSKTRVGGTKHIHADRIQSLQPDLIIANKEENVREQVASLAADYPVWLTDVTTLPDACAMIREIGSLTHRSQLAGTLAHSIEQSFAAYQPNQQRTAAYLIWREPYMTVGADTFIHDLMARAGLINVFAHLNRYPVITVTDIRNRQPDALLLSSEPYPFAEKHIQELKQALPHTAIHLVDGELFSWYGSRLQHTVPYFQQLNAALSASFGF